MIISDGEAFMYTIQQAAHEILRQAGSSLKSIEIARRILEQQLLESSAKNPIQSISQALERNIRMNKGNTPALQFIETPFGREIDIVDKQFVVPQQELTYAMLEQEQLPRQALFTEEVTITLPKALLDKVKIYQLGKGMDSLDEAFVQLLRSGLFSNSTDLIEVIKKEMENL